jgi:hypothetical protein
MLWENAKYKILNASHICNIYNDIDRVCNRAIVREPELIYFGAVIQQDVPVRCSDVKYHDGSP